MWNLFARVKAKLLYLVLELSCRGDRKNEKESKMEESEKQENYQDSQMKMVFILDDQKRF